MWICRVRPGTIISGPLFATTLILGCTKAGLGGLILTGGLFTRRLCSVSSSGRLGRNRSRNPGLVVDGFVSFGRGSGFGMGWMAWSWTCMAHHDALPAIIFWVRWTVQHGGW